MTVMSTRKDSVTVGMDVRTSDDLRVGQVIAVDERRVLIGKHKAATPELEIPIEGVARVAAGYLILKQSWMELTGKPVIPEPGGAHL
jgi:hypothetical protein